MNAKYIGKLKRSSLMLTLMLAACWLSAAEPVKDFTLKPATSGADFKLSEQKGKFVILHFLLKTECPICLKHTREYISQGKELPNAAQIFIKPDAEGEIQQWSAKISQDLLKNHPIYRDPEATLAKTMGVPDGYKFHGQVVHFPALILINPKGEELFRYIGKNNGDRYPFGQLKAKIEQSSKQ
ncbi:MAG: Redoxin domain protein [Verrucomicrobia bacterium]|jgi:peroxiredoxin Q/BCP|nr:Redoxin domain protein [Verrucomicrobiota bacterium]